MSESSVNKRVYCYCYIDGEVLIVNGDSIEYRGGRIVGVMIDENTSFEELVHQVGEKLGKSIDGHVFRYTLEFDKTKLIDLVNDAGLTDLINFTDRLCNLYIFRTEVIESANNNDRNIVHHSNEDLLCGVIDNEDISRNYSERERNVGSSVECSTSKISSVIVECTAANKNQFASEIWKDHIIGSGQKFKDASAFRLGLYQFSIAICYKFKRNSKSFISVDCKAEGCPWHLTASKMRSTDFMVVGTFLNVHNHCAQDAIQSRPSSKSKFVAAIISEKMNLQPDTTPHQIRAALESECGIPVTYQQAWACKEQSMKLLHRKVEDSYKFVPWLCEQIKDADPQSVLICTYDNGNHFKQLFIAYGCSIIGFLNGCLGLIFIDGCHLSGPYKGTLLSASSIDANNQLFPLAYAIVSSESLDNWMWFLEILKSNVTRDVSVTIISDRNQNIITSVGTIFGSACHAYCYRHIKENFSVEVSKLMHGGKKVKEQALQLLDAVVYARLEEDYNVAFTNLTMYKKELGEWVLDNQPEHWVMSKFSHPHWDHITSNVAESFNAWLVKERRHNIISLINEHREKLAKKIYKAKSDVSNWKYGVGKNVEEKLLESIGRSKYFHVSCYSDFTAKVSHGNKDIVVNLSTRQCTCLGWQMSGLPCAHASAVIEAKHGDIYQFVDDCYKSTKQELIYSVTMAPVETHNLLDFTLSDSSHLSLKPPLTKRPPGRPKVKRIESQFIKKREIHCSKCKQIGHNRASCRSPNPV